MSASLIVFSIGLLILASVCVHGNQNGEMRCYGRNEEYTSCGSACGGTCDGELSTDTICIALCVPGCFCKPGFLRNRWGVCIQREKCPCRLPNEIYACGSACQTECATLNETCKIINIRCNDSCYCKDGYARDKDGLCIPISKCNKT